MEDKRPIWAECSCQAPPRGRNLKSFADISDKLTQVLQYPVLALDKDTKTGAKTGAKMEATTTQLITLDQSS